MGRRKNYKDIIAWWSGGVTSAVTCMICIETYGRSRVRVIFIDTHNEHEDTYRFKKDCEDWYKLPIETISNIGEEYKTIQDVWIKEVLPRPFSIDKLKMRLQDLLSQIRTTQPVFSFLTAIMLITPLTVLRFQEIISL